MVNKDFRHHEACNGDKDNHEVILVYRVDALQISIGEYYGRKASWWLYLDPIDINVSDGMKMTLSGLAR